MIGTGITLGEAMEAADKLESIHGISVRVMDPFTIKPLDKEAVVSNALEVVDRK